MWCKQSAVVIGRGHANAGVPCQDKTFTLDRDGVTAIALADGAGSARLSQEGAACAVEAACNVLCSQFDTLSTTATPLEMRVCVLNAVVSSIRERAAQLSVPVSELACTLLAVAVKGDSYLIFHVGDGVIGYQKKGKLRVASAPENGEFSNTTVFVTSAKALYSARVMRGRQPELEGFVLMSDGCEAALYHKKKERIAPLVSRLFQRAVLLDGGVSERLLELVLRGAIARRTRDDCSLAILVRTDAGKNWEQLTAREQAAVLGVATGKRSRRRRQINKYACKWRSGEIENPVSVS